jgi:hypothetical protein
MKLWMTMLAQAGVSLGLAAEVAVKFPEWGSNFQTTMISVVLINQFVGPVLCKWALTNFGEAGKMEEGEEEHGEHHDGPKKLKRAVICGVDSTSLAVAAKLLKQGWRVSLMDTQKSNLILAKSLGIAKKDTNSTLGEPVAAEPSQVDSEDASLVSADHSPPSDAATIEVTVDKEPLLDLLLVGTKGTPAATYSAALEQCHIDVSIINLPNDQATYELGAFLSRARHCPRVLCRVSNPAWTESYKAAGLLPVSVFGASSQTIVSAALSRGNLQVVSSTLPLADALRSLIDPVEDLQHLQLPMSGQERVEWDEAHPHPTADAMNEVAANLKQAGVDSEAVRLLSTVSHGQREEYIGQCSGLPGVCVCVCVCVCIYTYSVCVCVCVCVCVFGLSHLCFSDKLHRLHSIDFDHGENSAAHDEQHKNMFMGIAGHSQADEHDRAVRKQEAQEQEEAEAKQVEMAMSGQQ